MSELESFRAKKTAEWSVDPKALRAILGREADALLEGKTSTRLLDACYREEGGERSYLNIGPGSFQHPNWRTADKAYEGVGWTQMRRGVEQRPPDYVWDIYSRTRFPEEDGFFSVIYCSHVIEHCFDEDVDFLFREAKRVLRPGCVLRLVCPDARLLADAYLRGDWHYFFNYLCVKTKRRTLRSVESMSERERKVVAAAFVIEFVSLLGHAENPLRLTGEQAADLLDSFADPLDAFPLLSKLSSRSANEKLGAHVNWFTQEKIVRMLEAAGFGRVLRSGYLQSTRPELRDRRYFDRTDPEMSLFVEAIA